MGVTGQTSRQTDREVSRGERSQQKCSISRRAEGRAAISTRMQMQSMMMMSMSMSMFDEWSQGFACLGLGLSRVLKPKRMSSLCFLTPSLPFTYSSSSSWSLSLSCPRCVWVLHKEAVAFGVSTAIDSWPPNETFCGNAGPAESSRVKSLCGFAELSHYISERDLENHKNITDSVKGEEGFKRYLHFDVKFP